MSYVKTTGTNRTGHVQGTELTQSVGEFQLTATWFAIKHSNNLLKL